MLYLIHGTDREKARVKAHELIETLKAKRPDAEFFSMDADNFNAAGFKELVYGQALFAPKFIVFLNAVSENKEAKEILLEKVKDITNAGNAFVALEGKLDAKSIKALEKHAAKTIVCGIAKAEKPEFNMFALGEALGKRDKKELWVLLEKARRLDMAPEQIHGMLAWKVRDMAGNPYKAKQYSSDEIKNLSVALASMYHDAHRGVCDFDAALERFVLSL